MEVKRPGPRVSALGPRKVLPNLPAVFWQIQRLKPVTHHFPGSPVKDRPGSRSSQRCAGISTLPLSTSPLFSSSRSPSDPPAHVRVAPLCGEGGRASSSFPKVEGRLSVKRADEPRPCPRLPVWLPLPRAPHPVLVNIRGEHRRQRPGIDASLRVGRTLQSALVKETRRPALECDFDVLRGASDGESGRLSSSTST